MEEAQRRFTIIIGHNEGVVNPAESRFSSPIEEYYVVCKNQAQSLTVPVGTVVTREMLHNAALVETGPLTFP